MRNRAFSLTELMVVIAIIGVLAAISVPAYKTYRIKAEMNLLYKRMGEIIESSKQYNDAHGMFPTAQQAGFDCNDTSCGSQRFSTNPARMVFDKSTIDPDNKWHLSLPNLSGQSCSNQSLFVGNLTSPTDLGAFWIQLEIYKVNGIYYETCTHEYWPDGDINNSSTTNIMIPGCYLNGFNTQQANLSAAQNCD